MADDGFIVDLEQQLLGAILSGGDHRGIFAMVDDNQLVDPVHREIFAAARLALERFSSTTVPVVIQLIPDDVKSGFKESVKMELGAYMAECTSATLYSAGTAVAAARKVIAQWARIQLGNEARAIAAAAAQPEVEVKALLRELAMTVDELGSSLRRSGRAKSSQWAAESARAALAASRLAKHTHGLTGITTGLADLDRLTGGLQRGDLILLGARPSMGKTSLATSIAISAGRVGHGVGVFSLEMTADKLTPRMLSDLAFRRALLMPYENIIHGTLSEDDLQLLDVIEEQAMRPLPIKIDDSSGLTISDIRTKTENMVAECDAAGFSLDLLVIDHLLKIHPTGRYSGNRVLELGEITEGVKELAKEYGLAALLLTQLNRAVETRDDKRPMLSDLRDSGAIEQDADAVMFLYRDAYYLERENPTSAARQMERDADLAACRNLAEVAVAKQRNGRIATVELFTDIGCSHFGNTALPGYAENARAA